MRIREEAFPFAIPLLWLGALLAVVTGVPLAGIPPLLLGGFVCFFFRDPSRVPPAGENLLVSPADGRILTVGEEEGRLRISIFMSIFNVHVNRSPADGIVRGIRHSPGRFRPAWQEEAVRENEQNRISMESDLGEIEFVQVAGLVARRIACWVAPECRVAKGERVGLVRFGSRVDVYVPLDQFEPMVVPGDRVLGGASALARRKAKP